ncbi:MAG: ABC transporter ATP-binding protein [Acholeplasmatales bacterium]|nr:MAG: ABC transporter ATP-binding protein [Acholeplasmatales bacterium]
MDTLRVENIRKTFNLSRKQRKIEATDEKRKIAVDAVSFEAVPGEIFGLLGPNGAGKTTALRCIATLIRPDEGDVFVGPDSVLKTPNLVRKNIAFLTNELKLEDHFTPNYLFSYFSRLHKVPEATMLKRREALFSRFGIDKFQEVKVADLSTGMKQKISIAISLVHDPHYIIFDEPTNGLDVLTAKTVTDYLIELKEAGKVVILSTHILSVVEKLCDRVAIIIDGRLTALDTLQNVRSLAEDHDLETVFFDMVRESEALRHA